LKSAGSAKGAKNTKRPSSARIPRSTRSRSR
jgi:hypothetical protein